MRKQKGFTLVEMLVVLLLTGLLCSMAAPSLLDSWHQAQLDAAAQQIHRDIRWAQREAAREQRATIVTFYRDRQPYRYKIAYHKINQTLRYQTLPCYVDKLSAATLTIQPDKSINKNGHILLRKGEHERYVYYYQTGRTRITKAPTG